MREQTKQSLLRKDNHANFENILENRRTQWQALEIYIFNKDKTDVVYKSSIGYRHSRLSSFGTSNFFKKICVPARGYFYSLSSQLRSPLAGAVALFMLRLLHSTGYWYLCFIDQLRVNF